MRLNQRIYNDLAASIQSGAIPCDLTLSALAEHYGVSPAPIRAAVSRLVDEGLLLRQMNGRLGVLAGVKKRPPSASTAPAIVAPDTEHEVRLDIINLSLRGESGFVREEATAERHGIGRTALRPILARLAGAGLLEKSPRRGWRVHAFEADDLDSFLEVRELLETRALVLARPRLEASVLGEFLVNNQRAEQGRGPLDNRLHDYWIQRSENRYLRTFFERDAVYYRSIFDFATPEAHQVTEMAAQHAEILQSLLDRRWALAAKALATHIRSQRSIVLALVDQLRSKPVSPRLAAN